MDAEVFDPTDNTFQFRTRVWQVESGFPQNGVQSIAQTSDGFLWLGTQHGLVRFDGYEFSHFEHEVLKNEKINALVVAVDGSLWVGTATHGVYRLQGKRVTQFSLQSIASPRVLCLCADPDGTVLIGTISGLAQFDGKEVRRAAEDSYLNNGAVRAIVRRPDGAHWFATTSQIVAAGKSNLIRRLGLTDGLKNAYVRALLVDEKGILWIGSNAGLSSFRRGRFFHYTKNDGLPDETVSALFQDHRQRLWVGTFNGLCRKVNDRFVRVLSENGEPFDQIFTITEDQENSLWAGFKDGMIRLREDRFKTYLTRDGLAHNNVISVLRDGEGLWVGTWGGGLHYFKGGKVTVWSKDTHPVLKNDLILAMHKSRDGSLWFGTDYDGGLYQLKEGKLNRFNEAGLLRSQAIRDIHEDTAGDLWVATSFGLIRRRGETFERFQLRNGLPHNTIRCLAEDNAHQLWVGTENGLVFRRGESFEGKAAFTNLPNHTILSLYADGETNLWIGTLRGLACWTNGELKTFADRSSLLTNAAVEIIEDGGGFLWLSSDRGILRVRKSDLFTDAPIECDLFGREDGMLSSVCVGTAKPASSKSADGMLWFATTRGVVTTDYRRRLPFNSLPPPTFITRVVVNKNAIPFDKTTSLPPGSDSLEFSYSALSFREPERNQFKYQLLGFDPDWVDADARRTAFYNNLPPGNYRFRVLASNNDGIWSKDEASISVTIEPHFWQTRTFQVAGFLGLAFAAAFAARHLTRKRLHARLKRLEQEHALEKERTRIAQDMHDELGARITEILLVGKSTLHRGSDLKSVEENVGRICQSAQEIATDLNAIVFAVNPQNDSLEHFVAYIYKYVEKLLGATAIRCRIDVPLDVPDMPVSSEVRHHVVMSIKEALNNALKHSEATEISVEVEIAGTLLRICLQDNGKGFKPSETDRLGNGLLGMRKRMKEIGGCVAVDSIPGKGTRIRFEISLKR